MLSVREFKHLIAKLKVLRHSAVALNHLFRDSEQPGVTPDDWSQAQSKDHIISQISEAIHNKTM